MYITCVIFFKKKNVGRLGKNGFPFGFPEFSKNFRVFCLALYVMYDATGVRLHAGRQAEVLNQIVYELPAEHPLAERMPLHELLGHTPPQVHFHNLVDLICDLCQTGQMVQIIKK
ncbi:hypothetical protein HanPI659440_Chr17g0702851 [Helianthus annuus]|nr:hypothetical protein HanPI659440_Chr17g0702851 [Helianthus annuus]